MPSPTTDAFTTGLVRTPCINALAMKGMYVSFTPWRASHPLRIFSRNLTMRVISTLKIVCTCALVRRDSTMRSAIFLRMGDLGTRAPDSSGKDGARSLGTAGLWAGSGDDSYNRVDLDGGSFFDLDLTQYSGGGSWYFGINFVGRNLEQRLVTLDLVAHFFEPLGDGAFKNRFPHLRHDHVRPRSTGSSSAAAVAGSRLHGSLPHRRLLRRGSAVGLRRGLSLWRRLRCRCAGLGSGGGGRYRRGRR